MAFVTIIIDMQEDFFSHKRLTNNRERLALKTNELVALSRKMGIPVVWIKQEYSPDLKDAPSEVQKNNIRIVVAGTPGANLLCELDIQLRDTIIIKKRYSAFFNTELDEKLNNEQCTTVIIAGINSHACVRSSVVDAFQRDYSVYLASDCIDSYDFEHHKITMKYLDKQLGKSMTNAELSTLLESS